MIFRSWNKTRSLEKHPWIDASRKDRRVLAGVNPRLKQIAYDRLAILREYHLRLSEPGRFKTKTEVMERFLEDLNSGLLLWPDGATNRIRHLARPTLYGWDLAYANGRLAALVPRYGMRVSSGKAIYRPLVRPIEMKFPGRPRASGKKDFIARVKRLYKGLPLEHPIRLGIFYSFPIPINTRMGERGRMLRHQISHIGKPNLEALDAFIMDSMRGIVFRDYSQIVLFHSEKKFGWWPQTRVLIKPLPG